MAATNAQVQKWADSVDRKIGDQIRAVLLLLEDSNARIEDIYAAVNDPACDWTDSRGDTPPHYLTKADVLSINAFSANLVKILRGQFTAGAQGDADKIAAVNSVKDNLQIVLRACVNGV